MKHAPTGGIDDAAHRLSRTLNHTSAYTTLHYLPNSEGLLTGQTRQTEILLSHEGVNLHGEGRHD